MCYFLLTQYTKIQLTFFENLILKLNNMSLTVNKSTVNCKNSLKLFNKADTSF